MAASLLFVCLGNICRSPTAEGVMRRLVADAGLADLIELDSAGTGDWHVGDLPDQRAIDEAAGRGVVLDHRARQVAPGDFARFDLLLAMDQANFGALRSLAPDPQAAARVRLLRSFDPDAHHQDEVPDPYFGGDQGFALVYDMVEAACRGLLDHVVHDLLEPRGDVGP